MNAEQARMARALLKLGVREVAAEAGVTPNTISRIENGSDAKQSTFRAIRAVYESRGVVFIPENGGGAGVRMAKKDG